MSNIIEMKNIHKFYKNGDESLEALKGVSFALEQGEILAIMGSSGSGKSTLLHIIGAMDVADEGEIYLNGTQKNMELSRTQRGFDTKILDLYFRILI